MQSQLAHILYTLVVVISTCYNFLFSFFPMIPQISEYRNDTSSLRLFSLLFFKKVLKDQLQTQLVKMVLINVSAFAFMCVLFCGIQFFKSSRKIRKNYQQNIVTFNQNFYFYVLYSIINLILTIVRMCVLDLSLDSETPERVLIVSYLIKLFVVWLLRPLTILLLLRRNMPEFFEDFEDTVQNFTLISQTLGPRNQQFLTYKPFSQNARWGSEKKFMMLNTNLSNQQRKYLVQSNIPPRKLNTIPEVYF